MTTGGEWDAVTAVDCSGKAVERGRMAWWWSIIRVLMLRCGWLLMREGDG